MCFAFFDGCPNIVAVVPPHATQLSTSLDFVPDLIRYMEELVVFHLPNCPVHSRQSRLRIGFLSSVWLPPESWIGSIRLRHSDDRLAHHTIRFQETSDQRGRGPVSLSKVHIPIVAVFARALSWASIHERFWGRICYIGHILLPAKAAFLVPPCTLLDSTLPYIYHYIHDVRNDLGLRE